MTPKQKNIVKFLYHLVRKIRCRKIEWDDDYVHLSITHYPAFTANNINTWQKIDYYRKCHRISQRAGAVLNNPKAIPENVHYEHIEPVQITKNRLQELIGKRCISRKDIEKIMSDCEVIIISNEERNILDGNINTEYPLDGELVHGLGMQANHNVQERLNALMQLELGFGFDVRYINNNLFNV
jgi:hypothetical protein